MNKTPHTRCDILLAYPSESVNIFGYMIPLGLSSIAAVLEESGYNVKIIDFSTYTGDFRYDLLLMKPSIVGIGGTTPTRKGSFHIAKLVKEVSSHIPVVYGGIHASFTAEDTLSNIPEIDYIIKGEGEFSFLKLAEILTGRRDDPPGSIPGIAFRKDSGIFSTKASRVDDLNILPMPARHLFGKKPELKLDFFNLPAEFIMTSRGCPACCSFCSASRMFPGGVRFRSAEKIGQELESILSQSGIKALKIFDSTFTSSREHVESFCAVVKNFNLLWECEIRADDNIDLPLLKLMKESGCCYVNMGLETTSENLLAKMGKKITVAKVEQVLQWCRSLEIKTKVFFTFGHLNQSRQECFDDIAYMKKRKEEIDFFATTVGLRIYPGTALEKAVSKEGLLDSDFSWANYNPPLSNLMLLEFGDVLILRQKHLGISFLSSLIIRLLSQKTVLSPDYIFNIIIRQGISNLFKSLLLKVLHTFHILLWWFRIGTGVIDLNSQKDDARKVTEAQS